MPREVQPKLAVIDHLVAGRYARYDCASFLKVHVDSGHV